MEWKHGQQRAVAYRFHEDSWRSMYACVGNLFLHIDGAVVWRVPLPSTLGSCVYQRRACLSPDPERSTVFPCFSFSSRNFLWNAGNLDARTIASQNSCVHCNQPSNEHKCWHCGEKLQPLQVRITFDTLQHRDIHTNRIWNVSLPLWVKPGQKRFSILNINVVVQHLQSLQEFHVIDVSGAVFVHQTEGCCKSLFCLWVCIRLQFRSEIDGPSSLR